MNWPKITRLFLSGLVAGLIGGVGALVAVAQEATSIDAIKDITWLVIVLTAGGIMLKDWYTHLKPPPE